MKTGDKRQENLRSQLTDAMRQVSELKVFQEKCRLIEADLRQQNEFFHQVLESLTHPFYVLDANDYSIKVANSAARLGDLSSKPTCFALTHRRDFPCDGQEHTCPLQVVKKTKKPFTVEHIHYDKDGNKRNVEVHAYPILDNKGNVIRMIEYSLDITDRKNLEKEIKDYADKMKLFAYSISHDLKNPIIGINGLIKLLNRRYAAQLDKSGQVICSQIMKISEQALALIDEIKLFIRIKELPLDFEMIKPKEILRQIREEFSNAIANRHINWLEPEDIPEIRADKLSLLRIFRNLVDNALKYGGTKLSEIKICYEGTGSFHIFSVSDNGSGIAQENLDNIFGLFQQGEGGKKHGGLGLGLAIVREAAERHGGQAWVKREPERGVTFYVSLAKSFQNEHAS
jgi:K+-sensing histidine kinase KdpD